MSTAAWRGRGGAAAASPVNQRAVDFRRQLDAHTRTLVESFGSLLRSAKITHPQNIAREDFQVNVATASLATAGEGLLRQIREVKLAVMLQDEAAMDREMDLALAKIATERAELEKELEALSNEVKAAYAKVAMGEGGGGAAPPQAMETTAVDQKQEAAAAETAAAAPPPSTTTLPVPAPATAATVTEPPPIPPPAPAPVLMSNSSGALEGQGGFASAPATAPAAAGAVALSNPGVMVKEEAKSGAGPAAAEAAAATATGAPNDPLGSMDVVGLEGVVGEGGKGAEGGAAEGMTR